MEKLLVKKKQFLIPLLEDHKDGLTSLVAAFRSTNFCLELIEPSLEVEDQQFSLSSDAISSLPRF